MAKRTVRAEPTDGFSIGAAARLSSVEPDTLRVWERRYGFPKPARSQGGVRVYSAADVELLKLIARAQREGFRAGELVGRTRAELLELLDAAGVGAGAFDAPPPAPVLASTSQGVDRVLEGLRRSDVNFVRRELRRAALTLGPKAFVRDLAAPLAIRVGELWELKVLEVHHEHLISNLLSTELRVLLSAVEEMGADKTVLLAAPSGELHELSLEMVAVYLAFHQILPRFLGADTPATQIVQAAESLDVDAVGLSISLAADPENAKREIERVARGLSPSRQLWLGGAGAVRLSLRASRMRIIADWAALDEAIRDLRSFPPPQRPNLRVV